MDIQLLVESNRESKQSSPKKLQNKEPPMLPSFNSIAITAKMSQVYDISAQIVRITEEINRAGLNSQNYQALLYYSNILANLVGVSPKES